MYLNGMTKTIGLARERSSRQQEKGWRRRGKEPAGIEKKRPAEAARYE